MANTTQTSPDSPDPMAVVQKLVDTLERDLDQRMDALNRMSDFIDRRNQLLEKQTAEEAARVKYDLQQQMDVERQRNKRAKWYTGILGVFAVLMGVVLFTLVVMMALDMNRMEAYMYNMGHAADDRKAASKDTRKTAGQSFMFSMASNMDQMRTDMASMNAQMTAMRGDMGQMRVAIAEMNGSIGGMGNDMGAMTLSMGKMQYDVLLMRQGVGNMATDTGAMSVPFRAMDNFIPFR